MDKEIAERTLLRKKWHEVDGCWLIEGTPNNSGYVAFRVGTRTEMAHRVAHTVWNGSIPAGHLVRHSCDIRHCINPDHLSTGTAQENSDDMVRRNRVQHEDAHWNTRLAPETVLEIYRAAHGSTLSQIEIGGVFGVSQMTVSLIKRKRRWRRFLEQAEHEGRI